MNTLSIEQLKYSYFDEEALRHPSYQMYRVSTPKGRYYYTFDKRKKAKFYISVTNILKTFTPTPDYLIKWIAQQGEEGAEKIKNRRAAYGTLMHDTIEDLLINRKIDLDDLPNRVHKYFQENDTWGATEEAFVEELYRDITGFAQFMIDKNVKPLAIEVILKSDKYKVAGAVDLFCVIDWRKTRKYAIIDFKGGKKGFYESNELQLAYYKKALIEEWPEFKDDEILLFNWGGKNWYKKPGYNLVNQTGKHSDRELKLYSDLYREKTKNNPVDNISIVDFHGIIDISKKTIDENYTVQTLNKKVKDHDKDQKPSKSNSKNSTSNNRKSKNRRKEKDSGRKGVSRQPGLFQSDG